MSYSPVIQGTKIPKAFKKPKSKPKSGIVKGKMMYMQAIKQSKKK